MSNQIDTAETIDQVIIKARRLAQRYPAIVPMLSELVRRIDECDNINEDDALACLRFHYQQPSIAEPLMHLAQIAREQAIGRHPIVEVDDEDDDADYDDWAEESTIPAR